MSKLVLLDTVVLGLATNVKGAVNGPVLKWINRLMGEGNQPYVPEIADYELRRELIRIGSKNAIAFVGSNCCARLDKRSESLPLRT